MNPAQNTTWAQVEEETRRLNRAVAQGQCDPEAAAQHIRYGVEAARYQELSAICKKHGVCFITATQAQRPKPGDKVKEIGWAHPGSDNAKLFADPGRGCYTLSEGKWPGPLNAVAGCEAGVSPLILLGERLDGVWSPNSMF